MFWGGGILIGRIYNYTQGKYQSFENYKLAIVVDDEKAKSIPNRGYYHVDVDCGDSYGSWDYNAWNLKIDNASVGTKCNITFTSGLSESEYKEYLEAGVNARRNTYRGKDITYLYDNQKLYDQIGNCTFDDIYVGDYFTTNNVQKVTWLIADINNYLHSGDKDITSESYPKQNGGGLMTCHATIIPATTLGIGQMNTKDTTGIVDNIPEGKLGYGKGAYVGSYMWNVTLPSILESYITPTFGEHVITTRNLLADQFDNSRSNQWGTNDGASSGWAWYDSKLDLMSEVNVYGSTVWSSSGYDIGIDNRQYAIFKLKPEFINSYGTTRFHYWLKAVAYSTRFARVGSNGFADANLASSSFGVRPRFLID